MRGVGGGGGVVCEVRNSVKREYIKDGGDACCVEGGRDNGKESWIGSDQWG